MPCADCKFWDQEGSPPPTHHRCFRFPPVYIFDGEEAPRDWCGEYSAVTNGER